MLDAVSLHEIPGRAARSGQGPAPWPQVYGRWLAPWRLIAAKPRVIEPDYPRPDVGSYMLFVGPDAVVPPR